MTEVRDDTIICKYSEFYKTSYLQNTKRAVGIGKIKNQSKLWNTISSTLYQAGYLWRFLVFISYSCHARALNIRLSYWCCCGSIMLIQIPSRENKNLSDYKYNSNPYFPTHTYIYNFEIQWGNILHGCHLLRFLYNILYFLWLCDE